jgi:hypothetical protein
MKLIDKIQKAYSNKPTDYSRVYNPTAEIIEKIADDYAIEFAEWYLNLWQTDDDSSFDNNSPKELLEKYKKERNL